MRAEIGDLDRVLRVAKVFGMVNADPSFEHCNLVINGASDVFCEIFGPQIGVHARSSLVVAGLVGNTTVEVESIFHVRDCDLAQTSRVIPSLSRAGRAGIPRTA